jgi:hypothetical protein
MKKIIRKILKEDRREEFLNKIIKVMKNDYPLLKNMELYGFYDQLSDYELNYVLSGIFGEPVRYSYDIIFDDRIIYDENGNELYIEYYDGYWIKKEYDENGRVIYFEDSDGYIEDYR